MWLSFYNPEGVGDVLMLTCGDIPSQEVGIENHADITRIYDRETKETVGYNISNISDYFVPSGCGHVHLSEVEKDKLNQLLYEHGLEPVELTDEPRIVTARVLSCEKHPDSDHLYITQTQVGQEETLQIVCGAANVHSGMTAVCAMSGAVMPDGQIIWSGKLRGVESQGMLCSAYELGWDPNHERKGILELKDEVPVGRPVEEISREDWLDI